MELVPWSYVNSWSCDCCGYCCKGSTVVLRFSEWLNLINTYGVGATRTDLNKFYMGKKSDGSCLFLYWSNGKWLCGLQKTKPLACKLWPFRVLSTPRYGHPNEAHFNHRGRDVFVYVDPNCHKITWGYPSSEMVNLIIPEFVEIATGSRENQIYSTSKTLSDFLVSGGPKYRII